MTNVVPIEPFLAPVVKTRTVKRPPAEAFALFTDGLNRWWPRASHSVFEARAARVGIDPFVGGEIYEVRDDGERLAWGRVLAWEPPARVAFTWHPGHDAAQAQEVEVTFAPDPEGTRLTLTHSGWQALGDGAAGARRGYDGGWESVLGHYEALAKGEPR